MKKSLLGFLLALMATCSFAQPSISSFSPATGPIGTSVTISGAGFSTVAADNIVYFGAVKAAVTASTANTITATVPAGANYKPVTVTVNGLTAYSAKPFSTTFPGGGINITGGTFDTAITAFTDLHPNGFAISDFDGDGKPDIATANNYSTSGNPASFTVLRNTSTPGFISMAPKIDFPNGVQTYAIASGDIGGDGKADIVASSIADQGITVYRNTSTIGNISFAAGVSYVTGSDPFGIVVTDLNLDGKPDVAVTNYLSGTVSLLKNNSSIGSV